MTSVDPSQPSGCRILELQRGWIIQEVNHKPVNNVQELQAALQAAGDRPVLLLAMIPNSISPGSRLDAILCR